MFVVLLVLLVAAVAAVVVLLVLVLVWLAQLFCASMIWQPRTGGENFVVLSGPCASTQGCVQSRYYPSRYSNNEFCEIVSPEKPVYVIHFATESGKDILTMNGLNFAGSSITSGPSQGISASNMIQWRSSADEVARGWQLCIARDMKLDFAF